MSRSEHREQKNQLLKRARRLVVKIGSSSISGPRGIDRKRMRDLVEQIAAVHDRGFEVVVVTSGAVAAGMARLGLEERPKSIPGRQAAAAVGQIALMAAYAEFFDQHHK